MPALVQVRLPRTSCCPESKPARNVTNVARSRRNHAVSSATSTTIGRKRNRLKEALHFPAWAAATSKATGRDRGKESNDNTASLLRLHHIHSVPHSVRRVF